MKREEKYKMYWSVSRFCILSLVICCALLPSLPAVLFERGAETFLTFESLRTTNPIFSLLDLLLLGTLLGDCIENRFHLGPGKLKEYFWHCENPLYYLSTLSQNKSESLRTEPVMSGVNALVYVWLSFTCNTYILQRNRHTPLHPLQTWQDLKCRKYKDK